MTSRRAAPSPRRWRRTGSALASLVGLAVVAGCGVHPGSAAVVGSETITHEEVDRLARALCAANIAGAEAQGQPVPELPIRGAREGALQVLVDTALAQQFGEARGVDPSQQQLSQALAQNEQGIRMLPPGMRAGFRAAVRAYTEGQLMLVEIGRRSLAQQGRNNISTDEALAEGERLRSAYVSQLDVEVDPRYGSFSKGTVQPGTSSLSVPASGSALAGAHAQPGAGFISSLPESQKCG